MPKEQIFVSYSHKDNKWRDELDTHLKPYVRDRIVSSWSDQQILPGSQWFDEIQSQLASSKIAVLLVSPDFLDSDFIDEHELGPLLKKANQGGVKILWIPVRSSAYKQTPLKTYQAIIDPSKPLAGMPKAKRDQAWVRICEEIEKAVNPSEEAPTSSFHPPSNIPQAPTPYVAHPYFLRTEAETEVARRILAFMEDRRVLYAPGELQMPSYCSQSVLEIRSFLTTEVGQLDSKSELAQHLRAMRAACRKFLDFAQSQRDWQAFDPTFSVALGKLRGVFGIHIAFIAVKYKLDIEDELANILPGENETKS